MLERYKSRHFGERLWDAHRGCAHFGSVFGTLTGGVEHPWDAASAFGNSRGCSVASTSVGWREAGGKLGVLYFYVLRRALEERQRPCPPEVRVSPWSICKTKSTW